MDTDQPIRSVIRALEILKTINRLKSPSLTDISKATGLPYPTTFRIVQTLIHEGIIEQEPFRKRYRATELVKALSMGFQEDDKLLAAAFGPMQDFTTRHLWPVTLAIRVGNRMMVKHSTHQLTSQTFINYYPGYTLPLLDCAAGRAYLAFCDDDERETIVSGFAARPSPQNSLSLQLVTSGELLGTIRRDGYAEYARTQHNETPGRTSAFAVPILSDGKLKACLTLVFFARAHTMEDAVARYLDGMRTAAEQIGGGFLNQ